VGVEERLRNLEDFLAPARTVKAVPKDVYIRLKKLEDRVLALERKGAFGSSGVGKDTGPVLPSVAHVPAVDAMVADKQHGIAVPPVSDAMDSIYSHLEAATAHTEHDHSVDLHQVT